MGPCRYTLWNHRKMEENKIIKYIRNDLSFTEREEVISWVESNPDHQNRFNRIMACEINKMMSREEPMPVKDHGIIEKADQRKSKKVKIRMIQRTVLGAAAAVLLAFVMYQFPEADRQIEQHHQEQLALTKVEMVEYSVNNGENRTITLPDGTVVNMNAQSSIRFPKTFDSEKREVYLEGEAFFDVVHDEERPFTVQTSDISIKVLGTTFNVRSYPGDERIETTLVTGKIELQHDEEESASTFLNPSEKAVFNKSDQKLVVDIVNSDDATAWKRGVLIFNQTPLKEVINEIERKYNVQFEIPSNELLEHQYTGTFDNLDLKEVLKLLELSSLNNYELKNDKIMIKE